MEKEIVKEYSNGEITVVWKPKKCIHSGVCVKMLPQVYNPKEKPRIKVNNATTDELKNQIDKCPSGALSYYFVNKKEERLQTAYKVELMPNGPIMVNGPIELVQADGKTALIKEKTAFCRCGGSGNKPFCDGSHVKIGFQG